MIISRLASKTLPLLYAMVCLGALAAAIKVYAASPNQKNAGVGMSVYFDHHLTKSLFEIALDHPTQFEGIAFFSNEMKTTDPSMVHCQALVWVPLREADIHPHNRVQCEADWGSTPKQFFINLAGEKISHDGFAFDPSFSITGPFALALFNLIDQNKRSAAFLERYKILVIKDEKNRSDTFILGKHGIEEPFLMCNASSGGPACKLMWSNMSTNQVKISLGDHGVPLAQAICSSRQNLTVIGLCPNDWNDTANIECAYIGQWASHDVWGIIDPSPKLVCQYEENRFTRWFEVPLGPVVTKAWGGRYHKSPSIEITGAGLMPLYHALKAHALTKKTQAKYALSYSELGSGEWGQQSVSLKRYATPNEMMSSFSCEFVDTSYKSSHQVPHKNIIFEKERYLCTIHNE